MDTKTNMFKYFLATAVLVLIVYLLWLAWPMLGILTDAEAMKALIMSFGVFAPLFLISIQIIQIVIAPIPATVITLAGGYIFETYLATLYAMIGTTIGFWIVFTISRKFGVKVIKYFASEQSMDKYNKLASSKGMIAFIVFGFVFPFLPDAVLGYIAGLTPMRIKSLLILSIITRTPGVMLTSFIGSKAGNGEFSIILIALSILAVVLLVAYYKKDLIYSYIDKFQDWMLCKPANKKD
jgi:uncharacterized membrane protein YdjX (TVP38/TMEM64 family)